MKIAVLGSGKIGGTLGGKWLQAGHEVVFGVRNPESPSAPVSRAPDARFDTVANAVEFGPVVVLAVPNASVEEIVRAHASALEGKIIIDTTNNFAGPEVSKVKLILEHAPSAKVYRAFNYLGWENFHDPELDGQQVDLFYCGPDVAEDKAVLEELISQVGLRPIWVGSLDKVGPVDSLLFLWATLAHDRGLGRHTAFKMLTEA